MKKMGTSEKSNSFWPKGKELCSALILVGIICVSGFITYSKVMQKIDKDCSIPTKFTTSSFDFSKSCIPCGKIYHSGPSKDAVPVLSNPEFVHADHTDYLEPDDRVVGLVFGENSIAYPLKILAKHCCINAFQENYYYAVTYCDLTDSVTIISRKYNDEILTFGIAGLVYQNNILLFDRRDQSGQESLWIQLTGDAVCGSKTGSTLKFYPYQLVSWKSWKTLHPETVVISNHTKLKDYYTSDYQGNYLEKDNLEYPILHTNHLFPVKEKILAIRSGDVSKVYPIQRIEPDAYPIIDSINDKSVVLKNQVGSVFIYADEDFDIVHSLWFAFYAFHPTTQIYDGPGFDLQEWKQKRELEYDSHPVTANR